MESRSFFLIVSHSFSLCQRYIPDCSIGLFDGKAPPRLKFKFNLSRTGAPNRDWVLKDALTEVLGKNPKLFMEPDWVRKFLSQMCTFPTNIELPLETNSASLISGSVAANLLDNNTFIKEVLACLLYALNCRAEDAHAAFALTHDPPTVQATPPDSDARFWAAILSAMAHLADRFSKQEAKRAEAQTTYLLGNLKQVKKKDVSKKATEREVVNPKEIATASIDKKKLQKKAKDLAGDRPARQGNPKGGKGRKGRYGGKRNNQSYNGRKSHVDHYESNDRDRNDDRDRDRDRTPPRNNARRGRGRGGK
jgi:hypothetical protein